MWGVCVATLRPQQLPAEEQEVGSHEGTFLSSSKAEAAKGWGLGPGLKDPAVGTGGGRMLEPSLTRLALETGLAGASESWRKWWRGL